MGSRTIEFKRSPNTPLGMTIETDEETRLTKVKQINHGSLGDSAGFSEGDILVSINGAKVYAMQLDEVLEALKAKELKVEVQSSSTNANSGKKFIKKATADSPLGLGFATEGGVATVFRCDPTMPAYEAGIRVGNVITHVNGKDISDLSHEQILSAIKGAGTNFTINVESGAVEAMPVGISSQHDGNEPLGIMIVSEDGETRITKCKKTGAGYRMGLRKDDVLLTVNGANIKGQDHSMILGALQAGGFELLVSVHRPKDGQVHKFKNRSTIIQDLGCTIEVTKKGLVQVKDVLIKSAAEAAGLKIGDVILELNGKSVLKKSLTEVVNILRSDLGPEVPMIVCSRPHEVVLERDFGSSKSSRSSRTKYSVEISRAKGQSLGMSLITDENGSHIIGKIDEAGPAFKAGIRSEDHLVAINGIKMSKRDHESVLQTLSETIGTLSISISRISASPGPHGAQNSKSEEKVADSSSGSPSDMQPDDFDEAVF
eukprot:m.20383 g.20383  ORF g.20383 m.20383 type:complete len:486 (+) comp6831_c0_seq1:171-1628(+)